MLCFATFRLLRRVLPGAVAGFLAFHPSTPALAQNGDKAGEVQKEVVAPDKIPPAPVLSPEQQLSTFRIAPGFQIELVAAEPLVQSPVSLAFDPTGRAWIVEMQGYMPNPEGHGETNANGRIVILTDTNGDGRMDHRSVFLDGLVMPRTLMLFRDGALIAEPPRVWYCRDTNGDGVADEKTLAFEDYAAQNDPKLGNKSNPEHASNSLMWALDNWIYSANHTLRYRHTRGVWEKEQTPFRGQWGLTQDDQGRLFYNSNSDQLRADLAPSEDLLRNPALKNPFGLNHQTCSSQKVWPARVNPGVNRGYQPNTLTADGKLHNYTAACGPVIYRGDQFPPEYRGTAFLCEPSANLIRANRIIETEGVISATNRFGETEFLTSTDERFRPVNLHNGPDGTLYVVDFARGLIQHRIYLTSYLRKQIESRNLQSPIDQGRIWRIVHSNGSKPRLLPAPPSNLDQWLDRLNHPNGWWRDTAQRVLIEKRDPSIAPRLRQQALGSRNPSPHGRLHALWTLEGLDLLDVPTLEAAIDDLEPTVRMAAVRLCTQLLRTPKKDDAINAILRRAGFFPSEQQVPLLIALGRIGSTTSDSILRILLMNAPVHPFRVDAALSGLGGRELEFLEGFVSDPLCTPQKADHSILIRSLARCVTFGNDPDRFERLLGVAANAKPGEWQQLAILDGILETIPPAPKDKPATPGKMLRLPAEPRALAVLQKTTTAEITNRLDRLEKVLTWPGRVSKSGETAPVAIPLESAQKESFQRGKEVYELLCVACHQPHGLGQDGLAPPLVDSEWTLGSTQRLVRIVLHGVRDAITVLGKKYELNMPALAEALDDQQIADVLTYVRREWNHAGSPVTSETVKAIRTETAKREDSWTEAELLKIP